MSVKFHFSGYATRFNVKCSDGRTILPDAFAHQDGYKVPLVWQHQHNQADNVLGHAILEHREDGVYAYGVFNDTKSGQNAKALVKHGDIASLSIYANQLKQDGHDVQHGMIKEVSLVLSGANPEAVIDNVVIEHSDGSIERVVEEAIIHSSDSVEYDEGELVPLGEDDDFEDDELEHGDNDKTVKQIFDSLSPVQKKVVYFMIGKAIEEKGGKAKHEDGGEGMKTNVFDGTSGVEEQHVLSHSEVKEIMTNAAKVGKLSEAVLEHAGTYGIDNIDLLFPDAKAVMDKPEFIKRRTEWVSKVLGGTKKSPFSRIKTLHADITADEARAKGYVTGAEKKEEVFGLLKRETSPTTIYKKQKLDRDDMLDITSFDVVAWLKAEMRIMLDEEIARAILIGDGRDVAHADKINENRIIPIYKDADMYSHKVKIAVDKTDSDLIDEIVRARKAYKGSGRPTLYVGSDILTEWLLLKDADGKRLYKTESELAAALRVKEIVEVEVMDGVERVDGADTLALKGIIVNLSDYTVGADKGGKLSMFDDFDIDFNQHKYLIEGRMSGMLRHAKSALVIEQVKAAA